MSRYPDMGPFPTAMGASFYRTANLNADGTQTDNPVTVIGTQEVGGVTYVVSKLTQSDSIQFEGASFVVQSAVPQSMTTAFAYANAASNYDPKAMENLDFTIPAKLNGGNPTVLSPAPQASASGSKEQVFVTTPGAGDEYFLPNLPNSSGEHDGLTANVYWTVDPYIGQPGFQPAGPVFHLAGYGWALDARGVNQSIFLQRLQNDGGSVRSGEPALIEQAAIPFNYWKHLISRLNDPSLQPLISAALKADSDYPFPFGWVNTGAYLPLQPMPGFQQNLIRYYTAWGAWNLLNNTSGLFVTLDGKVEIPSFTDSLAASRPVPLVVQTWDASQRFTVLNRTAKVIPSTYDLYPGNEVYFAANAYLPGAAGVLTSYVDYTIFDGTGKLNPRQTDLWLGFAGDPVDAVMRWADDGNTEPGGQANKPFMMGADSSLRDNGRADTCRLQISNSFLIVRYAEGALDGKLYFASLYAAPAGGDYTLVATLSYTQQQWRIDPDTAHWILASEKQLSNIPVITVHANVAGVDIKTSTAASFSGFSLTWNERPFQKGDANALGAPPQIYTISGTAPEGEMRFLVVLSDTDPGVA